MPVLHALLLGLSLSPVSLPSTTAGGTAPGKAQAPRKEPFALAEIRSFAGGPFGRLEIEAPVFHGDGVVTGAIDWWGSRARAIVHPARPGISHEAEGWLLGIDLDAARLDEIVPLFEDTVVGELSPRRTGLVLSTGTVRLDETTMAPVTRDFYRSWYRGARIQTEFGSGINAITRVQTADGSPLGAALGMLGIETDGVLLQGTILKDAKLGELREAKKSRELKKKLRESMELRASLPAVNLTGLPGSFSAGEASLIVTGRPGVGVAFRLTSNGPTPESSQAFECRADVSMGGQGETELQVLGTAAGVWDDAFGLRGFDLHEARLLLEVDSLQRVGFGVRAGLAIGGRQMAVAGKLQLHAVTGAVTGGLFEGQLESLGSQDLVLFANAMASAAGGEPMPPSALPDFELRDMYLKFAPAGGDSDLGVSEGFALRGELFAFGREIAHVDGALTLGGLVPDLSLAGAASDLELGVVALRGAEVDIRLGLALDQRFRVAGETQLLGRRRSVDIDCSLRGLSIDLEEELGGVYRTTSHYSSPSSDKVSWDVRATFHNDLARTLETDVTRSAEVWASEAQAKFKAAQADLELAEASLVSIDHEIDQRRGEVERARAPMKRKAAGLQADVARIQVLIDTRRGEVKQARKASADGVRAKLRARTNAKRSYDAAVRARKRAPLHKRPKLRLAESKALATYGAAKTAYRVANTAHQVKVRVSVDSDPEVAALIASKRSATAALGLVEVIPVDLDAEIVALKASRKAAELGLGIAQRSVEAAEKASVGAARVTGWLAKNNAGVVSLDGASFDASLAGYLRGNRVEVILDCRFLGEPRTVRVRADSRMITDGRLFDLVWDRLRVSLES